MLRVLLVVDGTPEGSAAIEHLIDLAVHQNQVEAILLCVRPSPSEWQKRGSSSDPTPDHDVEMTQHALAHARQRLDAAGIPYETRAVVGDFAQTVASFSRKECCDLIIIAQKPMRPFARALLALTGLCIGSPIDKVMPLANVPVTVVTRLAQGVARPGLRHPSSQARITPLFSDERRGR